MPLTSPGNDDDTGENHQPTLRKNTAEPVEQTLKQNRQRHQESMDMAQKQYTAQTRSVLIQQQMLDQQRKATADDNPSMPTE